MTVIIEQQIDCGGHPVHSLQAGPDSGPVILLLHGMKFQAATWQETGTLLKLAEAGYRSVAVDMPGFGRTAASDIKPAAVIKGVLNGISRDKAILIGPSMGGRIALNFTLANLHLKLNCGDDESEEAQEFLKTYEEMTKQLTGAKRG